MTFFLPEQQAGRVALGAEVRLVIDAIPEYVIPAQVSWPASLSSPQKLLKPPASVKS
jgi:HlyD family secretion protein